ncbi:MAG: cytochrome c-type biogenesis protein CcmH [Acidimicrobiia bacterium]|nr:cytochrome c-type biogenesis protein CcmH [Acidimicrobiia bacterium]
MTKAPDASGSTRRVARPIGWIGLLVAAVALLTVASLDTGGIESDAERIQRLNESFACPVCSGESVADSNAAVSATIRQRIAEEVTNGSSDVEIRDQLVAAYGVSVLLNPPADGFAALIWILPVVVAIFAAMGAAIVFSRAGPRSRQPTEEDRELVERARRLVDAPEAGPGS